MINIAGQTFDKERVSLNLARLKKGGEKFEVVVNPEMAIRFKQNPNIDIKDVLKSEKVFSDAKKGLLASEKLMQQVFKTFDFKTVAKIILEEGEIQLTESYRTQLREEKKRAIIEIIHKNAIDPKTKLPHPVTRIENALNEAKISIDEFKKAEDQVQDILKKIRLILPISFEQRQLEIKIPAEYTGKCYSVLKNFGKMMNEEWKNDGSFLCKLELPAGMQQDLVDKLNNIAHGNIELKVVK